MNKRTIFLLAISLTACGQGFFLINTTNMSPAYNPGDKVLILDVDFAKPDVIGYRNSWFGKDEIWISRLIAVEGDVIEMKGGVVFLNDSALTINYEVQHSYTLESNIGLRDRHFKDWGIKEFAGSGNSYIVYTTKPVIDKISSIEGIEVEPRFLEEGMGENKFFMNPENWNRDWFGPIKIPKGKVFVMGDNRHNSYDSRYGGFLDLGWITGKVQ